MSSRRKRYLSSEQLDEAVGEVLALAAAAGVRAALAGGVALQYRGSDRLTGDIDFVAQGELPALVPTRILSFGGYAAYTTGGVPVDWILREDDAQALYEEALDFCEVVEGVPMVRLEYMVAMKMRAGRVRDVADLYFILTHEELDRARARVIVQRHLGGYAARDFDALLAEATWRKTREGGE